MHLVLQLIVNNSMKNMNRRNRGEFIQSHNNPMLQNWDTCYKLSFSISIQKSFIILKVIIFFWGLTLIHLWEKSIHSTSNRHIYDGIENINESRQVKLCLNKKKKSQNFLFCMHLSTTEMSKQMRTTEWKLLLCCTVTKVDKVTIFNHSLKRFDNMSERIYIFQFKKYCKAAISAFFLGHRSN